MTLRGMTWSHPRATKPLAAFADLRPQVPQVLWDAQPLAAFEAHPINELALEYDLLVIDHPGIGSAVAADALRPLSSLFDPAQLEIWERGSVGPTWSSYHYRDQQWAIPIDAATQVSVVSAGLDVPAPRNWAEVPDFARTHPTTLCLAGPHAGLTLLAMASSADAFDSIVDPVFGAEALDLLKLLWPLVDQSASMLDPIGVHAAISESGPLYCPLAYGYANYTPAVRWADAPAWGSGRPGSVLGGTGLAVSALTGADPDELRAYVTAYVDPSVQNEIVPAAGGQPATAAAWTSPAVDRAAGGYYRSTINSINAAWVRPRFPGWVAVQDEISEIVRETITGTDDSAIAIVAINDRYHAGEDGR